MGKRWKLEKYFREWKTSQFEWNIELERLEEDHSRDWKRTHETKR
jgi:hypothetical protein